MKIAEQGMEQIEITRIPPGAVVYAEPLQNGQINNTTHASYNRFLIRNAHQAWLVSVHVQQIAHQRHF